MASDLDRMKFTQQLDQQTSGLIDFAVTLSTYLKALMENGFTRREAMDLVSSYQQEIFRASMNPHRPKGD